MLGYVLYFRECIGYFGSLNSFFINLVYSGSEIRKATGKVETQSIILTYFAWVASGVSIFYYLRGKLSFFLDNMCYSSLVVEFIVCCT